MALSTLTTLLMVVGISLFMSAILVHVFYAKNEEMSDFVLKGLLFSVGFMAIAIGIKVLWT